MRRDEEPVRHPRNRDRFDYCFNDVDDFGKSFDIVRIVLQHCADCVPVSKEGYETSCNWFFSVCCRLSFISPITPSKSFIHKDLAKNNLSLHLSHISPFISPVIIAVMQMFGDCKVKAERRDEGRDMGEMKGEMKIRRSLYLRAFQPIDGRYWRLLVKTLCYSSTRHAYRCYPSVFNQHHQFL